MESYIDDYLEFKDQETKYQNHIKAYLVPLNDVRVRVDENELAEFTD